MGEREPFAFGGTKLRANAALRESRNKDSLDKKIERIKKEVTQMIWSSARVDEIEEQKYPDGDGSEIAKEFRKREYRRKRIQPSYNGQIAVDDKEQVTVAADVNQNMTDHHEFRPMMEQVEQNLESLPKETSADAGYSSYENLEYA